MTKKEIRQRLHQLKESPLFNLSLGSRELFHSNFLYWLGGMYKDEVGTLFARFISDRSGDCSLEDFPQRERENIDLQFHFKNGTKLIVENKVKSIPYKEQLARYTEEQLRVDGTGKKDCNQPHTARLCDGRYVSSGWGNLAFSRLRWVERSPQQPN